MGDLILKIRTDPQIHKLHPSTWTLFNSRLQLFCTLVLSLICISLTCFFYITVLTNITLLASPVF